MYISHSVITCCPGAVGRRKSWVVPIQLMSALMLLLSASWLDARLQVSSCASAPSRCPSSQSACCWVVQAFSGDLACTSLCEAHTSCINCLLPQAADVASITILFFVLVLLAATQDIAVDGWALTLLSRRHIG